MAPQVNPDGEALNEVNVIPLADVTLVLLIILMVISPLVSQALIQVQNAQATAVHTKEETTAIPETPIIVSCDPAALKLNGVEMKTDLEFTNRLAILLAPRRDKSVILTASPRLEHGRVVWLMDLIKRHGTRDLVMVKWQGGAAEPGL